MLTDLVQLFVVVDDDAVEGQRKYLPFSRVCPLLISLIYLLIYSELECPDFPTNYFNIQGIKMIFYRIVFF